MTHTINFRISSKYSGITLEDITIDQALILIETIVGIKGPYKCTVEWVQTDTGDPEPEQEPTTPIVGSATPTSDLEPDTDLQQVMIRTPPGEAYAVIPTPPKQEPELEPEPEPKENINKYPPVKLLSTLAGKISKNDFTTSKYVPLTANLYYGETVDGELLIRYFATRIDTTWDDLNKLEETIPDPMPRGIPLLTHNDTGNRRSAVIRFIEQMRTKDIKQGQAIEILNKVDELNKEIETKTETETETIKDLVIFTELDHISISKLGKYVDINQFNMGYHDQEDGKLVICYGTNKVYTSWEDMFKLPVHIDNKSIEKLSNLKQVAVRQFRKWIANNLNLLPDGVDPDAEFRPAGVSTSVYPSESPEGQDFGRGNGGSGF